eukprot:47167_1
MKLHWQLLLGALGLCAIVGIGFGVKTLIGLSASEKSSATAADLCEKLAIPKNIDLTNGELSIDSTGLLPYLKLTCNAVFGLDGSSDTMRTCVVTKGVATWVTVENPPTCSNMCAAPPDDSILTNAGIYFVEFQSDAKMACKDATECAVVCKDKSSAFDPDKSAESGKVEKVVCKIVSSGPNVWVASDTNDCVSPTPTDADLYMKLAKPTNIGLTNGTVSIDRT